MDDQAPLLALIGKAQQAVDQAIAQLGEVIQQRTTIEQRQRAVQARLEQARTLLAQRLVQGTSGATVQHHHLYEQGLQQAHAQDQARWDAVDQQVQTAQQAYALARKTLQGYRVLGQRRATVEQQRERRHEQREQDEQGQRPRSRAW